MWSSGNVPWSACAKPSLPVATKLGQGNVFTGVCDSVNKGGGLPQCMLGYPPPGTRHLLEQLPPGADPSPLNQTPPGADSPPGADIPPGADPSRADPPLRRSRHPPGAEIPPPPGSSGIRSTSGRYASYWNSFLLRKCPDSITTFHTDSKNLNGDVCLKSKTCLQENSVLLFFFFSNMLIWCGVKTLNVTCSLLCRREELRTNFGSFGIITRTSLCCHNANCPSSFVCYYHPQGELEEGNAFSRVCLSVDRMGVSTTNGIPSPHHIDLLKRIILAPHLPNTYQQAGDGLLTERLSCCFWRHHS